MKLHIIKRSPITFGSLCQGDLFCIPGDDHVISMKVKIGGHNGIIINNDLSKSDTILPGYLTHWPDSAQVLPVKSVTVEVEG